MTSERRDLTEEGDSLGSLGRRSSGQDVVHGLLGSLNVVRGLLGSLNVVDGLLDSGGPGQLGGGSDGSAVVGELSSTSDDVVDQTGISDRSRSNGSRSCDQDLDRGRSRSWGRSRSRFGCRSADSGFGRASAAGTSDHSVALVISDVPDSVGDSIGIGEANEFKKKKFIQLSMTSTRVHQLPVRSSDSVAGFSLLIVFLIGQVNVDDLAGVRQSGSSGQEESEDDLHPN